MEAFIRGERVARCGAAAVIERRCQRSQPEAMTRGWMPERRYAEPKRGGRMLGQSLLVPFCWAGIPAFEKGTRRKGETIGGRYRRNGYVHKKNAFASSRKRETAPTEERRFKQEWICTPIKCLR